MIGVKVLVTTADLRELYLRLKVAEPALRIELRRGLVAAGQDAVEAVKQEASWSTRIPGAVKAKVSFAARGPGIKIVADANKAPEARPLENKGKAGNFRHPVYGHRNNWVNQPARPFFYKAIKGADRKFDKRVLEVATAVSRAAGFK